MADPPKSIECTEDDILDLAVRRGYVTREQIDECRRWPWPASRTGWIRRRRRPASSIFSNPDPWMRSASGNSCPNSDIGDDQATLVLGKAGSRRGFQRRERVPDGIGSLARGSHPGTTSSRGCWDGRNGTVYTGPGRDAGTPVALKFLHGDSPDRRKGSCGRPGASQDDHTMSARCTKWAKSEASPTSRCSTSRTDAPGDVPRPHPGRKGLLMARVADASTRPTSGG